MWSTHAMEHYPSPKKNTALLHSEAQINPRDTVLRKQAAHKIPQVSRSTTDREISGCRGCGRSVEVGSEGQLLKYLEFLMGGKEKLLELDAVMVSEFCELYILNG